MYFKMCCDGISLHWEPRDLGLGPVPTPFHPVILGKDSPSCSSFSSLFVRGGSHTCSQFLCRSNEIKAETRVLLLQGKFWCYCFYLNGLETSHYHLLSDVFAYFAVPVRNSPVSKEKRAWKNWGVSLWGRSSRVEFNLWFSGREAFHSHVSLLSKTSPQAVRRQQCTDW